MTDMFLTNSVSYSIMEFYGLIMVLLLAFLAWVKLVAMILPKMKLNL